MTSRQPRKPQEITALAAHDAPACVSAKARSACVARHVKLAGILAAAAAYGGPQASAVAQENAIPSAALEARAEDGNTQLLPLVSETVRVRIDDGHATATYDHVFQNESRTQLEGNYRLAVGEGATATGFSYWNGESRVVGEIFEREAAREVYEAMTGLRRDPGLLEQAGEGGFSFRVFPIAPGERKRVQVRTARWLPVKDGAVEYRVRLAHGAPSVEIELRDGRGATAIESPTHAISIETRDGASVVRVASAKAAASSPPSPLGGKLEGKKEETDLVLRYRPTEPPLSLRAVTHKDAGERAFVSFTLRTPPRPKTAAPRPAHDVTLVIDRSGSMSGTPMEAAKAAARKVVARLDARDAVNVVVFDDKVDTLFKVPQTLDEDVRREVDAYIAKIATRGGTNIAGALEKALEAQTKDARPDLVMFLTDGQSDGPSALAVAAKDPAGARVFTVGIGEGVDKALLARIASMRKGRFAFVADARAVEIELGKIVAQLEPPVLTDLKLRSDAPGTMALERTYPATLPDLFSDDELRVFARAKGAGKVIFEAKENGIDRAFAVDVDSREVARPWVGRSWAQARVDDLLGDQKAATDGEKAKAIDDEIVDLGLAFDLVTPRTSFLAIPEAEMTAAARGATSSMRERKRKILAAHKDAAALSRLNMPPGDPILRVNAPRDAKRVTASFPFGLTVDLAWDDFTETWITRFLVPKDVSDGTYEVPVIIVRRDGRVEAASVRYTIDAREPTVDVDAKPVAGGVMLRVLSDEPLLEARAVALGQGPVVPATLAMRAAVDLALSPAGAFVGMVPLSRGRHKIRVVVADRARNEQVRTLEVEVL